MGTKKLFRECLEAARSPAPRLGCTAERDGKLDTAARMRIRVVHPSGRWAIVGVSGSPRNPSNVPRRTAQDVRAKCVELGRHA